MSEFGSRSDPNGIQERMFRQFNIWACDRKHAKRQYCRISDFVVQKPMRTRSISKYHFQHPTDTWYFSKLKEICMQVLVSLPPSLPLSLSLSLSLYHLLSKFANSLDAEDLRRLAKPNQGKTGIPRINNESERPTLRPMPRKNIIEPWHEIPTMWYVRPAKPQISLRICTVCSEPLLVAWIFYEC